MPREMNPHDWVALAASRDEARPVLCCLHVTETLCEATDGYRLHRTTANGRLPGLWDVKSGASVPGSYPDTARVTNWTAPSTHRVLDTDEFRAVAAAAVAFGKGRDVPPVAMTWRCDDGSTIMVDARYVSDALRGLGRNERTLELRASTGTGSVMLRLRIGTALIMPIRAASGREPKPSARFDVSEIMTLLQPASKAAAAVA